MLNQRLGRNVNPGALRHGGMICWWWGRNRSGDGILASIQNVSRLLKYAWGTTIGKKLKNRLFRMQ